MNMQHFLIFYSVLSLVVIFTEYYFLREWKKHVEKRGLHKAFYNIPRIAAFIMFPLCSLGAWMNVYGIGPYRFIYLTSVLFTIWYLPKIPVVAFLLLLNFIRYLKRKFGKNKQVGAENPTLALQSRRKFLENAGWAAAGIPFFIVGKNLLATTLDYRIIKIDIPIANLPKELNGLRIVQISDIHAGSFISAEPFRKAVNIINGLNPDIIALTGDYINYNTAELYLIENELAGLKAKNGVFACLGNHDHYAEDKKHSELINIIRNAGIDLMINENRTLRINGQDLQIAGSDNSSFRHFYADFDKTLEGLDDSKPTILLCHDPQNFDREIRGKRNVDLMLSGHTHGGQVAFDMFGEVLTHVRLAYKQWAGLYSYPGQQLYVNRGLGTVGVPIRVGVRPEITEITLVSE